MTRIPSTRLGLFLALGALPLFAAMAEAQEPMQPAEPTPAATLVDPRAAELDAEAADIAAQLRCPVCSGQSVLESNSAIAQEMQEVIRERLDAGDSESEVLEYFRGSYGDWIILRPRASGLNLVVYVLPAIVLLAGIGALIVFGRRWTRAGDGPAAVAATDASGTDRPPGALSAEDEAWLRRSIGG